MAGNADDVVLKVYTKAMTLVGVSDAGPEPRGWSAVHMPASMGQNLAVGLYYYTVTATRAGQGLRPSVGRIYVLR